MNTAGIENMNVFCGSAYLDVAELARHRNLDTTRIKNLLMTQKSVALPYEDPVTFGINAAKPIVDALSYEDKDRIELLITSTESSFDFSKSMSTYMHDLLGLNRNCRLIELKGASYSGAAGFQMAVNFILSQTSPGAKALVIATDIYRPRSKETNDSWYLYDKLNIGSGAAAILISELPNLFQVDFGATGYYGYEVMDTFTPLPDNKSGDTDLSLLSYLDCNENAFNEYQKRVGGVDFQSTFGYLAFHTPYGGMVKGAHRSMMRKLIKAIPEVIEQDFSQRVMPGLIHCQRTGNIMGATTFLSLASTIDNGDFGSPQRVGVFSYGSGCCAEFFSGVVTKAGQDKIWSLNIKKHLDNRYKLNMDEYDEILTKNATVKFGTQNVLLDAGFIPQARSSQGDTKLFLKEIKDYHRIYE